MTTTFTKLAAYDKAIAEMQNSSRIQRRLGEGSPSLRSSHNGVFDACSDSDSDASPPGSGFCRHSFIATSEENNSPSSHGASSPGMGFGRHSFIGISEENNSPSSHGASYAFMASARGSRLMQEEELARLSDIPLNGSNEIMMESQFTGFDRSIRSPTLGKDKRAEYFAQIKSQMMMHGATAFPSTPPPLPPSSSPDIEEAPKRSRRFSLLAKDKLDIDKEKDDQENEEKSKKDKDKDSDSKIFDKKKEKEKQREEKQRKKQEKKEQKQRIKAGERDAATPSPENPRIMQQLLGAMRPRASLSQRGASELEEQLKRPIDTSPKESATLRRSASFKELQEPTVVDNRPKFEKILGIPPVLDINMYTAPTEETKYNWRKTKIVKNVVSDPLPILQLQPNGLQPHNSPSLQSTIPESDSEETSAKQKRIPKVLQLLGETPSIDINNLEGTTNNTQVVEMDIDEEGIVFSDTREQSGHRLIKGATLKKLVERLTCEYISDTNFLLQFIITYRSFTNPHELLELLKDRYSNGIEISADVTEAERETLTKKQLIVRLRVYNVIKQWIDKQWMDFIEDKTLVEKMLSYAPILNEVVSTKASVVEKLIEKKLAEGEKQKIIQFSTPLPPAYIPTVPRDKLQLMDMNSEEIARQMTLMEYSLFKAIKPWEYLCWNTKAKQTKSANILAMINKFNMMSKWVQREVLHSGEQPRQRALTIAKFLEICEHLRVLKNFNGIMEILSGLNTSSVHRLRATWGCLSSKQNDVFQEFNVFTTGKNYKNLRNALHTLQPPCIPYLGMYLTDLTFINDGVPLYLPGDSCLINFDKCRKVSASVLEIMQYQQTPFCLRQVDEIQAYLSQVEKNQTETEDELFKLSLALEERKKDN